MDIETFAKLSLAHGRMLEARIAYEREVRALLTPGTPVTWRRGRNVHQGIVEAQAYGDQFFVRNARTGKMVKLNVSDMLRAEEP